MKALNYPKSHGPMGLKKLLKEKKFKGVDINFISESFVCPVCGLEAGCVQTAGNVQRVVADAYREKVCLLTSQEIKALRKARGLTHQELAHRMNVGIADIKHWENGFYQYVNRMAHLYFLRQVCGVEAYLVFVYFVGDVSHIPTSLEQWQGALSLQKSLLGLKRHGLSKFVAEVFINTDDFQKR